MSEPSDKAGMDRLEAWMRKKMPNGVHRLMEVATADAIALALIDAGRMVRVGDDARWPDPPDPDAEYDAAVDRLLDCRERQFLTGRGGAAEALTLIRLDLSNARAARDAAKGKAVLK